MKKTIQKKVVRTTALLSCLSVLLMIGGALSSCKSSKSVKDVKYRQGNNVDNQKKGKGFDDIMTHRLFMENSRANISMPQRDGMQIDPETGVVTIGEDVTFTHAENYKRDYIDNSDVMTDTVYSLKEVTVSAKSRFTPEHDGRINVDFIIDVPVNLLAREWKLTLTPKLVDNDSVIVLNPFLVKGDMFQGMQLAELDELKDYKGSLVDSLAYDSVFLDRENLTNDISKRQAIYYDKYHQDWNNRLEYEKWLFKHEDKKSIYFAKELGAQQNMKHSYIRMAHEEAVRMNAMGQDSAGVYNRYMSVYDKKVAGLPAKWENDTKLKKIPKQFEELFYANDDKQASFKNVKNDYVSNQDSVNMAKHRYHFDQIVANEIKRERVDAFEDYMVKNPFETNVKDSVIITAANVGNSVRFLYKHSYPTRVGLNKLAIVLDGRVEAIDLSSYDTRPSDTISYFVASMAQLADMSLIKSEKLVYRDVYNKLPTGLKFAPNKTDFDVLYSSNSEEMTKVVDLYKRFALEAGLSIDSIEVNVSTSLEGEYENNIKKTQKRAESVKGYFERQYGPLMSSTKFNAQQQGEDWNTLVREIKKSNEIKNKEEILKMLTTAVYPDQTERDIKKKYPADFNYIYKNIYPKLDRVELVFNMHRPEMDQVSEVRVDEKPNYEEGMELLAKRDYWEALQLLSEYPDYNTALCLACLGYNAKAVELLEKQEPNGHTEYLMAILALRVNDGDEEAAIKHLLEACRLDPSKVYRAELDPEILGLVRKHNLDLVAAVAAAQAPAEVEEPASEEAEAETETTLEEAAE